MDIEVFITIHDQELLYHLENHNGGKYKKIFNNIKYTYLFVGKGDIDMIKSYDNVIICRDLEYNIEQYKYLVDFTAWYCIVKNKLNRYNNIVLLQYDTNLTEDFIKKTIDNKKENNIISYCNTTIYNENFWYNDGISIVRKYLNTKNTKLEKLVFDYILKSDDDKWITTNNICCDISFLDGFVNDVEKILTKNGNYIHIGHSFERIIYIYSILNSFNIIYIDNVLEHYQLNSHKTQNLIVDFDNHNLIINKFNNDSL